jgi:hypothetical protein
MGIRGFNVAWTNRPILLCTKRDFLCFLSYETASEIAVCPDVAPYHCTQNRLLFYNCHKIGGPDNWLHAIETPI